MAGLRAAGAPAFRVVEQTVEETVLTARAGLAYDVEMTAPTKVWSQGTRLEPDRALYSYAGKPVLHLRPYIELAGPYSGAVTGQSLLTVDLTGVTPLGLPLWNKPAQSPRSWETTEILPGGGASLQAQGPDVAIAIAETHSQAKAIREELGFIQASDGMTVTFTVTLKATVNQREYELPLQAVLPVRMQEDGFAPGTEAKAAVSAEAKGERVEQQQVPISILSRLRQQMDWIALGIALGTVAAGLFYIFRPKLGPSLLVSPEHRRFKDWITAGKVGPHYGMTVEVMSLEGLVDLAIDMNKRIIYDGENRYVVIDQEVLYVYSVESEEGS